MTAPMSERLLDLLAHRRILASAGSGKTFQLSNRYLALVNAGAAPASILASTFTRLAAGEIRDRILLRLAEAADDSDERDTLAEHLGVESLDRARVLELLTMLARQVHRMNVRTLDSFFGAVVSAFSLELGLPAGSRIIDEPEAVQLRAEAMRLMLDEHEPQRMIDLLRQLTQGTSQRSVLTAIDQVVRPLYELHRDAAPEAWDCLPATNRLDPPRLAAAVKRLEDCPIPEEKKGLVKAHGADLQRVLDRSWEKFISTGIAGKLAAGSPKFGSTVIPDDVAGAYRPLIAHAKGVLIGRVRDQTLATRDLLELFHEHYERLKRRDRVLTFADLTAAMLRAESLGTIDEIGYRLDATLRHLLLDEFQDTSVQQWNALKPFIREIVSNPPPEHTFFCVGDVKQSIYGWRDAAPDVLEQMPALLDTDETSMRLDTLETSFRSSPVVIDTVNRVFLGLTKNRVLDELKEVTATWTGWYTKHSTAKTIPGHAELHVVARGDDTDEQNRLRLQETATLAEELHARNPDRSIAILTRTNDTVAHLIHLLQLLDVPASGRGGGPLTDAPPVNVVLDALHLADHPDDTVATFNVVTSPLAALLEADHGLIRRDRRDDRLRLAALIRRGLLRDGYADTISRWMQALAPFCDARQLRRLLQLIDLADSFDARAGLRPGDFIDVVQRTDVEESRPVPVQVMTVHKAKGLEFDIVLLPELESDLVRKSNTTVVFEREQPTRPISRICRYMKKDVQALVPELEPLFTGEWRRQARESLSLLYVAMTRARQGLYMLVNPPRENEKTIRKTFANVLRFGLTKGDLEPGSIAFRQGDDAWIDAPTDPRPAEPEPPVIDRIELAEDDVSVRPGAAATAASAHGHAASLGELLTLDDRLALDYGTIVHGLFEGIEWLEDWSEDEDALLEQARALAPRREDAWIARVVGNFRAALQRPGVRELLSRGRRDPATLRVFNELAYARLVEGRVQQGRIDRLEAECDDSGAIRRAAVIDFKTDSVEPVQAAAHAERFRDQLEAYRGPAARRVGLPPERIELCLLFTGPGVTVRL